MDKITPSQFNWQDKSNWNVFSSTNDPKRDILVQAVQIATGL